VSVGRFIAIVLSIVFLGVGLATAPSLPARADAPTQAVPAKPKNPVKPQAKRHPVRRWHGYGFLPGYVPPEAEPPRRDYWTHPPVWWYGGPGFYRGQWNGGGFGPCWTQTPIGPMWNCGR
jgi:hypothetical protein